MFHIRTQTKEMNLWETILGNSTHAVRTLRVCRVSTGYVDRVFCLRIEEHAQIGKRDHPRLQESQLAPRQARQMHKSDIKLLSLCAFFT